MSEDTISFQMLMNTYLTNTPDHVYFKDRDGRFILVSDSLARSLGCRPEDVVGKTDRDFFSEAMAHAYRQVEVEIMTTHVPVVDREVMHVWPEGHKTWVLNDAQLIMQGGQVFGVMGTNKDITGKKILEQEVVAQTHIANEMTKRAVEEAKRNEHLAYHDGLTGLANRSLFSALVNHGIKEACLNGRKLAVLYLDLDRFKQINDTVGHAAGDELLQVVASRLKECVRASDTVARLGGDEFVVLLPEDAKDAATVAQKILSAVSMPIEIIGHEFHVTASVGIAVYPQDGLDEESLTRHADGAMYQAKGGGRNNVQFYSAEANASTLERLNLESSLRHALAHDEFRLHYQAKREVGSGAITGMEALLRWEHPDLGTIAPMRFIPVAEETGLIVPIGKWVLKTACLQNVAWQKQGLPSVSIAVNLTVRQFADNHLVSDVKEALEDSGMKPSLLELEFPEIVLIQRVEDARRRLAELKELGVRLVIDDFGTGYSSLATLATFPLDAVKIDRRSAVADDIIAMGKKLSLTVIAQGVETRDQAESLRRAACNELQGFYFKRPLPANEFEELLLAQAEGITYIGKKPTLKDV